MNKKTSWGLAADWYDNLLKKEGTYQKELILPNLARLINFKKNETVLDIACGQGFFTREFAKLGANVIGVDLSKELIDIALKRSSQIKYYAGSAENLPFIKNAVIDKITLILALQNIENISGVFSECNRVLKPNGKVYLVLNHPCFRIPKESAWGWDEKGKIQYRRTDSYLSESRAKIQMHPGSNPGSFTWSFHRPLQLFSKILAKNNFCISRIEEWNSHKKSEKGPRSDAEDRARREIPLFLFIEAIKS